jgi:hypothetical protein
VTVNVPPGEKMQVHYSHLSNVLLNLRDADQAFLQVIPVSFAKDMQLYIGKGQGLVRAGLGNIGMP